MEDTYAPPRSADTYKVKIDYFGVTAPEPYYLPDEVSYVSLKRLREGERRLLQNRTNRDITVQKGTGDAKLKLAPGDERYELLKMAIVGWNLEKEGAPLDFDSRNLDFFLEMADPEIIDLIEAEIRKRNPWLSAEMTVGDIDAEIDRLKELRVTVEEAERGKSTS